MVRHSIILNGENLTASELTMKIGRKDIQILGFFDHTKASERYVVASVIDGGLWKEWYIPYYYRRTNIRIETVANLIGYIREVIPLLNGTRVAEFKAAMRKRQKKLFGEAAHVTRPIFNNLLNKCGEWIWNKEFTSSNPQRRIQYLKELGFTIATKMSEKKTFHMLMPFDIVTAPTYETIPAKIRAAIIKALGGIDAYSGTPANISVLPDHKFPEIRWEAGIEESNANLSTSDMENKFQLVPERINQAKREVCRKCFQTGLRGKLNGIDFFYQGTERWPDDIPATGPHAKAGCIGCFWYDMMEWRRALNRRLKEGK
ncbi:MAG: hypothetical protein ACI4RA_05190 [Kiritimatiellia bacterium]